MAQVRVVRDMSYLNCWNCGHGLSAEPLPISRHATCDNCAEMLHCCRFCEQFERGRPGDCDNELTDPPSEKTSANFCEYFKPSAVAFRSSNEVHDQAKAKLDSLFGDDPSSIKEKVNPLDDLFND